MPISPAPRLSLLKADLRESKTGLAKLGSR